MNKIKESLEEMKVCAAVFLDMQAFDRVWHEGLLYKIKTHLPSHIYLILKYNLEEHYFQMKVDNEFSTFHLIKSGIPQGCDLGPFLYLLFTAHIPTIKEVTIVIFTDDTGILSTDNETDRDSMKLQNHLNILQNWYRNWKINVNSEKSTQISFTTTRCSCPNLIHNNVPIPQKLIVKYLGIHLDNKLTWKNHIKTKKSQLTLKVKQMTWLIGKK